MIKKTILISIFILSALLGSAQSDTLKSAVTTPPDTVKPVVVQPEVLHPVSPMAALKIWIKGFKSLRGSVFVGLYNKPQGFASEKAYRNFSFEITGTEMWVTFDSLVKGSYAVAVIHDENNNRKLDQGEMGIPTEGYGFSNDAKGMFGPPDFRLAMFYFSATGDKTIIINLLYPKKLK
jgi:uncharacterized protein (DUF2141 family)